MAEATHRAEVVPVVLEKHPDADSLSIVKVWGFQCVVRTEDWQGVTRAVYVQPDSVLPDKPEYRFLKETSNIRKDRETLYKKMEAEHESDLARLAYDDAIRALEERIDKNTKYLRIAARKLRGIWSMGMLLPIPSDCQTCIDEARTGGMSNLSPIPTLLGKYHVITDPLTTLEQTRTICWKQVEIGDDLAEVLGITHYEPPTEPEQNASRRHQGADVGPPPPVPLAPKYDVESAYRYAKEVFEEGELVYVSEKIDGQNARFVAVKETVDDGKTLRFNHIKQFAGSRTEWKLPEGESNWWSVQKQNSWIQEWCKNNLNKLMYGENYGWVQALRYGAVIPGTLGFRAFDILDCTRWLDAEEFIAALPEDHRVPSLGIMPYNFEKLVALADGMSLVPGANNIREGIVIKPLRERYDRKLGRVALKIVSNTYLEKSAR